MTQTQTRESRPSLVDVLNDLIQLDYDAIAAYEAAIERIDDDAMREQLREFLQDHRRHTQNLAAIVERSGGEPATEGDAMRYVTKGKVLVGSLLGDHGILLAMKTNEDETVARHWEALAIGGLDAAAKSTLEANLADERRHRAWFAAMLEG